MKQTLMLILLITLITSDIAEAQNVGIGTTSPVTKLEVTGASTGQTAVTQVTQTSTGHGIRSNIQSATPLTVGPPCAIFGDAVTGIGVGGAATNGTGLYGYATSGDGLYCATTSGFGIRAESVGFGTAGTFTSSLGPALTTGTGKVGIGTYSPAVKLDVIGGSSGQTPVLQVTQTSTGHAIRGNIQSASPLAVGNAAAVFGDAAAGIGIGGGSGTGTGAYGYSVSGQGVFGTSTSGDAVRGFCTGSGAGGQFYSVSGPALLTGNGNVGIGVTNPIYKVDVTGSTGYLGNFVNTMTGADFGGLYASCNNTPFYGYGIVADGGYVGVQASSLLAGSGSRTGVLGSAGNGATNYGVYGQAFGPGLNYAGYFSGNVYTTGTYLPSDRKLKNDIRQLHGALSIIDKLSPASYTYKTKEYEQMHLPEGLQYGLIAEEVKDVIPGAVIKAVQPAVYEDKIKKGKVLHEAVEFNAVNYTQVIPVLVEAIKEQQTIITSQQNKINEMEQRLLKLENK